MTSLLEYLQRSPLIVLFCLILIQCSDQTVPEQKAHIRVLDEIPRHIQEVENLTMFPGDAEPAYTVELIPDQSYGESGEPYLTQISGCVVDNKGRIIISDMDPASKEPSLQFNLHVYNPDGIYHTQIGRTGRGPGEYGIILGLQAKAGKIFALDATNKRLNEYSTSDYSYERSIPVDQWKSENGLVFGYVEARNDGNYLLQFTDNRSVTGRLKNVYLVMDKEGRVMDHKPLVFPAGFKISLRKTMRPTMPLTFLGYTTTSLSDEDVLYAAETRDFLIRKYDANGEYQSGFYYPLEGLPFDLEAYTKSDFFSPKVHEIENALEELDEELPETHPIIAKLKVDDENRIWVALHMNELATQYEWWILKESGQLLAKLPLSRNQPIYDIQNGYLYSKKTNKETGAEFVVRYRIEFREI